MATRIMVKKGFRKESATKVLAQSVQLSSGLNDKGKSIKVTVSRAVLPKGTTANGAERKSG